MKLTNRITNFGAERLHIYEEAIRLSGFGSKLFILREAPTEFGNMPGCFSLWKMPHADGDWGRFWNEFDKLNKANQL